LVASEQFREATVSGLRVDIPNDAEVFMTEIQALNIGQQPVTAGQPVTVGLAPGQASSDMQQCLERAYGNEADRGVLAGGAGGGRVELPAGRYINILATPAQGEYGVAAVSLDLSLSSDDPQGMIEMTMHQAAELDLDIRYATGSDRGVLASMRAAPASQRQCATIFRVISQVGQQKRLQVSFDIPDTLLAAGEPVWLTLRPKSAMVLDAAASKVTIHTLTPEQTLPGYLPRLERLLVRIHSDQSEAHAWGTYQDGYIGRYIARVLELDPGNVPAALIWNHVGGRRSNVELKRPGPADAPDWAVWERQALQKMHYWVDWWLDNRQQADGQLAGHVNDDGEFTDRWPTDYLITADPRVRTALGMLADVAWRMSGGKGYTIGSRDVEHAAEDQSCTQPQVLLTNYGSAQAVERLMKMSQYLDFWTAINEVGRRQFKSFMFTSEQIWGDPPDDVDEAYCPLAMVGAGHAAWYVNLPGLREIFLQEADSWRLATLSTDKGKPAGRIPGEVRFSNSEVLPYMPYNSSNPVLKNRPVLYIGGGIYIIEHLLDGATWLTGDDKYQAAMHLADPSDDDRVKMAQAALAEYEQIVVPPPDGPEKRYTVQATDAANVVAPLRPVRDGQALGAATADGQVGEATYKVSVPEAGRYAVWALLGRTDPADTSASTGSFFVDVDGGSFDRIRGSGEATDWVPMTSQRCYDLAAGEHTIHIRTRTAGSAVKEIGFTNKYSLDGTWSPAEDETRLYRAWRITGDKKWLVEELKEVVRQQERSRWLMTEAEPYTDRVNWPGERLLCHTCLGETTAEKSHVPGHWVSWEGGGTDFAPLVLDARRDHLKALVYSFADGPRDMKMRVWRMHHGRYKVTIGIDTNSDDDVDQTISESEMELARYDGVDFTADPGRTYVIELTLLQELDDITSRPDLAIEPWDVQVEGRTARVTVHNIGGAATPETMVQVRSADGEVLGAAQVPALQPPFDLQPKTATVQVTLAGNKPVGWVLVDPTDSVKEITEVNNEVALGG